jgi:ABC-2 type transport system ATP-binding protein
VLHQGRSLFAGTPASLIEQAAGRVWLDQTRGAGAQLAWRNGDGLVRNVGDAPAGAELTAPTLEDAYLLLVGDNALAVTS